MSIGSVLTIATTGILQNTRSVQESAERIVQQPVTHMPNAQPVRQTGYATDYTAEIVNMKQAEIGYAANATVIRTADSMSATLLDILA